MNYINSLKPTLTAVMLIGLFSFGIASCEKEKGPMEKLGESMDEAATDMGNAVEDACEEMKEGVKAKDTNC